MTRRIFFILWGCLLLLTAMFVQLLWPKSTQNNGLAQVSPDYHIQIIHTDSGEYFFEQFSLGAQAAGLDYNAFIEFISTDQWSGETLQEVVGRGIMAGVDGVAVRTNDPALTMELKTLADNQGIKLILYESDNLQESTAYLVSSNAYSIGMAAGDLAIDSTGGDCRAFLVLDRTETPESSQYRSMKIQGIIESFSPCETAEISEIYAIGVDRFAVESMLDYILAPDRDFNTIICLQEAATPMLAQRILDNDLVGEIQLIGYGMLPETLDYIKRGVIKGAIFPDAYDIGYQTVRRLVFELRGEPLGEYSSTRQQTITQENLADFLQSKQSEAVTT